MSTTLKEARALCLAVRRLSRTARHRGKRHVVILDSLDLAFAAAKGRAHNLAFSEFYNRSKLFLLHRGSLCGLDGFFRSGMSRMVHPGGKSVRVLTATKLKVKPEPPASKNLLRRTLSDPALKDSRSQSGDEAAKQASNRLGEVGAGTRAQKGGLTILERWSVGWSFLGDMDANPRRPPECSLHAGQVGHRVQPRRSQEQGTHSKAGERRCLQEVAFHCREWQCMASRCC